MPFAPFGQIGMTGKQDNPASRPHDENPEWTEEETRRARPALDVIAEVFGEKAADELRRGRGRPRKEDKKVLTTLRIDPDVLEAYQREGKEWRLRINQVLREHMPGLEKEVVRPSTRPGHYASDDCEDLYRHSTARR